jgi:hypothetical protein
MATEKAVRHGMVGCAIPAERAEALGSGAGAPGGQAAPSARPPVSG